MTIKSKNVSDSIIIDACKTSTYMTEACKKTGLHWNTFKRRASALGVYQRGPYHKNGGTNNCGFHINDILNGKHPQYAPHRIKKKLIKVGLKKDECGLCGLGNEWNGKPITLELDHIDGNNSNHSLENLRILCPNCHSQTNTYRSKNIRSSEPKDSG